jgi:hypothetical protein
VNSGTEILSSGAARTIGAIYGVFCNSFTFFSGNFLFHRSSSNFIEAKPPFHFIYMVTEVTMKGVFLSALVLAALAFSCVKEGGAATAAAVLPDETAAGLNAVNPAPEAAATAAGSKNGPDREAVLASIEQIAATERLGGYVQGLALAESRLREEVGDYAGAVAAAYRELAWAYGYGRVSYSSVKDGLNNVLALENAGTDVPGEIHKGIPAARAILCFLDNDWAEAERLFSTLPVFQEESDGFIRWLILVCRLEQGSTQAERSAYGSMMGRYDHFPEYWYRGARAFGGPMAGEYAERCINLAPEGPFAAECRTILAEALGLAPEYGASILTRVEIEQIISRTTTERNSEYLRAVLPVLSLPDNSGTFYAVNALRVLGQTEEFRSYFNAEAAKASGRLAERLAYIARG